MHYLQQIALLVNRARPFGYRTLSNGTQLFGKAPHVAPEAWLHAIFAPATDYEIGRIEQAVGTVLPEDFTDFLHLANGLSLFSDSLSIYGHRATYQRTIEAVWQPFDIVLPNTIERPPDALPAYFFVGGYPTRNGFFLYIDASDGRVYRCSRSSSRPLYAWRNFQEMIVEESNRLATFFDEMGRRIDTKQPLVP